LAEAKPLKQLKHASNDEGTAISLLGCERSGRQQHRFQIANCILPDDLQELRITDEGRETKIWEVQL
jgi:hypothetical protein